MKQKDLAKLVIMISFFKQTSGLHGLYKKYVNALKANADY